MARIALARFAFFGRPRQLRRALRLKYHLCSLLFRCSLSLPSHSVPFSRLAACCLLNPTPPGTALQPCPLSSLYSAPKGHSHQPPKFQKFASLPACLLYLSVHEWTAQIDPGHGRVIDQLRRTGVRVRSHQHRYSFIDIRARLSCVPSILRVCSQTHKRSRSLD